mgnify:CR=1 FL=1
MKRLLAVVLAMLIVPMVAVTAFAYEKGEVIPERDYLTLECVEDSTVIRFSYCSGDVQYKLNSEGWKLYDNKLIALEKNDKVSFKGSNVFTNYGHNLVASEGMIFASGTLNSLAITEDGKFQGLTAGQFDSFFGGTATIINADKLIADAESHYQYTGNKKVVVGSMATNTGATVAVAGIIAAAGIAASVYCLKKK